MSKQLKHVPGEPTLFAQTVARDILKQAREMDVAQSTKFTLEHLGGDRHWIYKQRLTGGNDVYVVQHGKTRSVFDKPRHAINCLQAMATQHMDQYSNYASKESHFFSLRAENEAGEPGAVVMYFAPTQMPPFFLSPEAKERHEIFHRDLLALLDSPPRISNIKRKSYGVTRAGKLPRK